MGDVVKDLDHASKYAECVLGSHSIDTLETQLTKLTQHIRRLQDAEALHNKDRQTVIIDKLFVACEYVKNKILTNNTSSAPCNQISTVDNVGRQTLPIATDGEDGHIWEPQKEDNVTFADVVGGRDAKDAIKESMLTPLKFPIIFRKTKAKPWRTLLLFGPPGTY